MISRNTGLAFDGTANGNHFDLGAACPAVVSCAATTTAKTESTNAIRAQKPSVIQSTSSELGPLSLHSRTCTFAVVICWPHYGATNQAASVDGVDRFDRDYGGAEQGPAAQELFKRNIGTKEQQTKEFPPHKIIGNMYYVGTEVAGLLSGGDAGGEHPDRQHLRSQRPGDPKVHRGSGLQILRHQDPSRQPRPRGPSGGRRPGQGA